VGVWDYLGCQPGDLRTGLGPRLFVSIGYIDIPHQDRVTTTGRVIGSPETVATNARAMIEMARPDGLVGLFSFGGLSHGQVTHSIELFGTKVIPLPAAESVASRQASGGKPSRSS